MAKVPWFVGGTRRRVRRRAVKGKNFEPTTASLLTIPSTGPVFSNADPEAEREPVPVPTPVTFPVRSTFPSTTWGEESPPPKLQSYFSRVVRPSDISASHVEALNIQVHHSCPPEELLPLAPDGSSYLPPLSPSQAINSASYADVAKESAILVKRRADLVERLSELRLSNDAGFRTITRTTKHGARPARLVWLRKFWEGLESVAQYWDTSLDSYYESVPAVLEPEKSAKRLRMDSVQVDTKDMYGAGVTDGSVDVISAVSPSTATTTSCHDKEPSEGGTESSDTSPGPQKCWRYKGRRTASGRDMPDQFRSDTVRAFVEGVVWPFNCTVAPPRHMPIVQMNQLNIPVRQTAAVYRSPKERSRARSGCLEGPMFAIQCRPDTDFDAPSLTIEQIKTRARLDLMRELGSLLQLAQERQRQGKVETRSGEGKWWTTEPRWGGGSGGEVSDDGGNVDVGEVLPIAEDAPGPARSRTQPRKKRTPAMLWKELRCGSKLWDPRISYEAIGKDPNSDWDEVFLVSSLNHHISVLKLTVHGAYIQYLQSETLPDPLPIDKDWCSPKLQRTQWYDLLDVDQRVQGFRALWGVTAYLTREVDNSARAGASDDGDMTD